MFHSSRATLLLALFSLCSAGATAQSFENYDVQSPAEIEAARQEITRVFGHAVQPEALAYHQQALILQRYAHIDTGHVVPTDLLQRALVYFDANKDKFPNKNYITIVDFKPRSDDYRFFVVNVADGSVERYHTTHGVGSDPKNTGLATTFGNVINSGMSSVGFARVGETYYGHYKRAVRVDGLSDTNSNLRARAVIVHGWDGVKEANVIEKRSHGCMTLDWTLKDAVIDKIKDGSLLYADQSAVAN